MAFLPLSFFFHFLKSNFSFRYTESCVYLYKIIAAHIRAAEIVKYVRKHMDGSSENLQNLSSY